MQLPVTTIGTYLVLAIDHANRLVSVDVAKNVTEAKRRQKALPADIPVVAFVRVINQSRQATALDQAVGAPVSVASKSLKTDAGVVIAAYADYTIHSVVPRRDEAAAYRYHERSLPSFVAHAVIGRVTHVYR